MSLFRKKCEFCKTKIEKGREIKRNVRVPGFIGTRPRNFCSEAHAGMYEQELEEYMKRPKKSGGCCG